MRPARPSIALAAVLLLAAAPPPDLAPPGMKLVRTEVQFEFAESARDLRILAVNFRSRLALIGPGTRVPLRSIVPIRLVALRADDVLDPDLGPTEEPAWLQERPQVELPIRRYGSVGLTSPIATVLERVRVLGVDGDTIEFERLGAQAFDADGDPVEEGALVAFWVALAATGATGLFVLAKRRRAEVTA